MSQQEGNSFLLVANWPSDVGFAWWLMESYWAAIAESYSDRYRMLLAYPEIRKIPGVILEAPIQTIHHSFFGRAGGSLIGDLRLIRRERIKVIYLTDRAPVSFRYAVYRLAGARRIVTHDHTPGLRSRPSGIKRLIKWLLSRTPLIVADVVLGATEFVSQRAVDTICIPANKCIAVPNGLPPPIDTPRQNVRERFGIPGHATVMVMAARANPYKGLQFLIDCLSHYESRAPDKERLHFLLLGDGQLLDHLKQQAEEKGIGAICHFPGYVDDVPELLESCDFAIHPSRGEVGYSLAILEYMRAGLPVVVPDNPSVCGATVDGQTGLIYPEGDRASCAAAISRLATDPSLRSQLGRAAQRHERNFSLAQAHAKLLAAIELAISQTKPTDSVTG